MNAEEIIAAQQKMIDQLAEMLQWCIENTNIDENDPSEWYWVEGKRKAISLLESLD